MLIIKKHKDRPFSSHSDYLIPRLSVSQELPNVRSTIRPETVSSANEIPKRRRASSASAGKGSLIHVTRSATPLSPLYFNEKEKYSPQYKKTKNYFGNIIQRRRSCYGTQEVSVKKEAKPTDSAFKLALISALKGPKGAPERQWLSRSMEFKPAADRWNQIK
jgi:hypothetical protein